MRCKEGDLAMVKVSRMGNEGKIVECVAFISQLSFEDGSLRDAWVVRGNLIGTDATRDFSRTYGGDGVFPASWLMPIRDPGDDAIDETLIRKGAPYIEHDKEKA